MTKAFQNAGLCALSLSAFLAGCNRQEATTKAAHATKSESSSANSFRTHYQDESQFIVETILADLVEMAGFARDGKLPSGVSVTAGEHANSPFRQPTYDVQVIFGGQEIQKVIDLNRPIWAPDLYENLAKTLLAGRKASSSQRDRNDLSLLLTLTEFRPATIETENQRLSSLLQTNFTDPTLHEMAAVLLGTFALRDFTDNFHDVRLPLCRMSAHLALARALTGDTLAGINGQVAEAMLLTLMNNQQQALEQLRAIEREPKLLPWVRALRARNTFDYRGLQDVTDPTQLERVMFCLAASRSVRADLAWEHLPEDLVGGCSDFALIAFAEKYYISLGHQLNDLGLRLELAEISEIYSRVIGKEPSANAELVGFMNQLPERGCFASEGNRVRIIGQGHWGMFLQRQLCQMIRYNFEFLQFKLGVPESARDFADAIDKEFGKLTLFPFVLRYDATTEEQYQKSVDLGRPIALATPQLLSPDMWGNLCKPPQFARPYWPVAHSYLSDWFKHNPPPGTAHDCGARFNHDSLTSRPDFPQILEELHQLAPYDAYVSGPLVFAKLGNQPNYQVAEAVYRPLLDYSAELNRRLAWHAKPDPVKYEEAMSRFAKFDSAGYFTLGEYFAERKEATKAALYYEKGVEQSTDAVLVANNCHWLVYHYYAAGQREKAAALADRAAATYSSRGLRVKADLLETEKKFDEALEYFQRLEERYDDRGPLVGFCVRYKAATGDAKFDKLVEQRLTTLFPTGIKKIEISDFKSPPEEGIQITEDGETLRQSGLKKGDIIVALDGVRVYDLTQYVYIRERTNAPPLRLIIWNGSEYREIAARPPNRRFGVRFDSYYQPANK